jgi:hypothetical protein
MANIFDTFKQGSNLGMFNYGQPSVSSFGNIEELISKLPADKQAAAREKQIGTALETEAAMRALGPLMPRQYSIEELEGVREREARRAQELGKESLRTAFPYAMLANIPKTISQGFGNIAAMNVLGARNATEAMAATLTAYPRAQFSSFNFQPQKYFE